MPQKIRAVLFIAIQGGLSLIMIAIWPRFVIDDVYIFLTYARNLAATGQFALNPGEVSYGFSSPAYTLLLAGLSRLTGIAVGVRLSNGLGVVLCLLASLIVWNIWEEVCGAPAGAEILLASFLVSGPWFFTVWFIFGMESGLAVLSLLTFLLCLLKLRGGNPNVLWLLLGAGSASVLATTRLESGLYIACAIALAFVFQSKPRRFRELFIVGLAAGLAESSWLLYAHHAFGTYMPWTSKARLIYYLPGSFGLTTADEFYSMGLVAKSVLAFKALVHMMFGGPMKLLLFLPLFLGIALLVKWRNAGFHDQSQPGRLQFLLRIAVVGTVIQLILFAYLFPLVANRHVASYLSGLWVLLALPVLRFVRARGKLAQAVVIVLVAFLWVGGAMQYRHLGVGTIPLHSLAASVDLRPTDRIEAEAIGILAFESKAHVLDMGGLSDRSVWPLLLGPRTGTYGQDIWHWGLDRGATKLLMSCRDHPEPPERTFGNACLVDAKSVHLP